jgi:uncharacterized protein with PIN domain
MKEKKFIADLMYGKLARYLRILGYDTRYPRFLIDDEIIDLAKEEGRIVLTADKQLYKKSIEAGVIAIYLKEKPIHYLLNKLYCEGLIRLEIDLRKTRCPRCNYPLTPISKPPLRIHKHEHGDMIYFICKNCGSIYWIGGHWNNIKKVVMEAKKIGCHRARGADS